MTLEEQLGEDVWRLARGLSVYDSFRSAVRSRKASGEFGFLQHEETPTDLLKAPFKFSFLKRPTTWVWLSATAVLSAYLIASRISLPEVPPNPWYQASGEPESLRRPPTGDSSCPC